MRKPLFCFLLGMLAIMLANSLAEAQVCGSVYCKSGPGKYTWGCMMCDTPCAPADQCHGEGRWDPAKWHCIIPNKPDGTSCNDGNACTQNDTCQAGTCVGSTPVVCTAIDQCHTAGTCDPATGCSNPAKPNGTGCNDGNACTQTDTCQAGACIGSSPVVCTAIDQCHTAGTCNPATGSCSTPTKPNGTACNDGNACTQADTCQAGTCVGSNPIVCSADQCHTAGTCNPATGACSNPPKPNGTACNDGNACTGPDTCQAGSCYGMTISIDDNNACTADSCDPAVGSVHQELRTALSMPNGQQRYVWPHSDPQADLYSTAACTPWKGKYASDQSIQSGLRAGMNLLEDWYGVNTGGNFAYEMMTQWVDSCECGWCPHYTIPFTDVCVPDIFSIGGIACTVVCNAYLIATNFYDVGTSPDDFERALRLHSPPGYVLYRWPPAGPSAGYVPSSSQFFDLLSEGNPVAVLLWTGKYLRWVLVTGLYYDANGTLMVRIANYDDKDWDWFMYQWSFDDINVIQQTILDMAGLRSNIYMYFQKTTLLVAGQQLVRGDPDKNSITSYNGKFWLVIDDQNLVLYPLPYTGVDNHLWRSGTAGKHIQTAIMQEDGNFVIYDSNNKAVWSSGTDGHPGAYLALQNDGRLVIYDANNLEIWSAP